MHLNKCIQKMYFCTVSFDAKKNITDRKSELLYKKRDKAGHRFYLAPQAEKHLSHSVGEMEIEGWRGT